MELQEVQTIIDEAREFSKTSQYADLSQNPKDIMSKLYGATTAFAGHLAAIPPVEPAPEPEA
jgi:hypothetical protein